MQRISLWLLPEQKQADYLSSVIKRFAEIYNGPQFLPHMTLVSGETEDISSIAEYIKTNFRLLHTSPGGVYCGSRVNESLVLRLAIEEWPIRQITGAFRKHFRSFSFPEHPHISLHYGKIDRPDSAIKSANEVRDHIPVVEFDRCMIVDTKLATMESAEDVLKWEIMMTINLSIN